MLDMRYHGDAAVRQAAILGASVVLDAVPVDVLTAELASEGREVVEWLKVRDAKCNSDE